MPQPRVGLFDELFSGPVTDTANRQLVQRSEGQPKVRREQPKTSTSPKVATGHAPKATGTSSRHASKKASTPPRLDAQGQKLFQEFLEWRRRQRDLP